MKYTIVPSKRFQKALNKLQMGGKKQLIKLLVEVIDLLAEHDEQSAYTLGTRWRDHALKGDKKGIRELHLSKDDLLLYELDDEQKIVKLLDITNHEELRKK